MDSLMNATTHSTTNRTEPTRPDRELPAREHYPARASTIRHRLERAHNPKVSGSRRQSAANRRATWNRSSYSSAIGDPREGRVDAGSARATLGAAPPIAWEDAWETVRRQLAKCTLTCSFL